MDECVDAPGFKLSEAATIESPVEVRNKSELTSSQIRVEQPEFPLTRRQGGKLLDVSDVSIGKWLKAIEAVGVSCTNSKGRITERGLELLQGYQTARDREIYLESLKTPGESTSLAVCQDSSLILDADFEELYQSVSSRYESLSDRERETQESLAVTEAQLLEEYVALESSRQQEIAAGLREAKMRGINKALEELKAEESAYQATINRYRREKEQKAQKFRASA
jgi:hypothetical protein